MTLTRPQHLAIWLVGLVLAFVGTSSCRRAPHTSADCCIDLLQHLDRADIKPVHRPSDALQIVSADVNGRRQPALSTMVPTRIAFTLAIPAHATLTTSLGVDATAGHTDDAGIAFRLGISDGRTYEQLLDQSVFVRDNRGWVPIRLDLSRYGGWQWSLFYHPSSISWSITLNTYPTGSGAAALRGLWAAPSIQGQE